MARQRNRTAAVSSEGELREEWFTVETPEGNAVGGVDGLFDVDSKEDALRMVENLVTEVGKPLTVVRYTRAALGTYAAITKVERVDNAPGD